MSKYNKTAIVIEYPATGKWAVSFTSHNPEPEDSIDCNNEADAWKLKRIWDEAMKESPCDNFMQDLASGKMPNIPFINDTLAQILDDAPDSKAGHCAVGAGSAGISKPYCCLCGTPLSTVDGDYCEMCLANIESENSNLPNTQVTHGREQP